jgi:hypothetical protein
MVSKEKALTVPSEGEHFLVFTTLITSGMAEAMRFDRDSLFRIGLLSNKPPPGAVVLTSGLQMAGIYIPGLQAVFQLLFYLRLLS